jgi:type I restriction enzyme M protein
MNLAIRGIEFNLGRKAISTFKDDQHKDVKFDYIMMNPPFGRNASYPKKDLLDDVRWKKYGIPREKPANYAWMSHAVHHLAPKGRAGVVMPRGTLTSSQGGDDAIRKAFLDDDIIECIIDLPGQLFFNVQIPSCLWFFNKDKSKWKNDRTKQVLFIDARKMGTPVSRTQIEFSDAEIAKLAETFNAWANGIYADVDGFCKSVTRGELENTNDTLTPGRYTGSESTDDESAEDFLERIVVLKAQYLALQSESNKLEQEILDSLNHISGEASKNESH